VDGDNAARIPLMLEVAVLLLATAAHPSARPNACQVLTKREVAAIQGEAYTDTRLTARGNISQCFYQLPTFTKSVSVDVLPDGAKEYWKEHFANSEESGERDEKSRPPLRVRGVGDEAFWVGSPVAGSLYVLKGNAMLRVSAGGPGTESEKIARSKRLAAKALRRL
jgi:hypothetical protein